MATTPPPSPNPAPKTNESLAEAIAGLHRSLDEAIRVWSAQPGQSAAMIAMALQGARGQIPAPTGGASEQAAWQQIQRLRTSGFLGPQVQAETLALQAQEAEPAQARLAVRVAQLDRERRREEEQRRQQAEQAELAQAQSRARLMARVGNLDRERQQQEQQRQKAGEQTDLAQAQSRARLLVRVAQLDRERRQQEEERTLRQPEVVRAREVARVQVRAQQVEQRAAYLATPEGRATLAPEAQARAEGRTAQQEMRAQQMRAETEYRATPGGRYLLGRETAARETQTTAQAEEAAQQARARAEYVATPAGQQELRRQAEARQRMSMAQEAEARSRATAEFGKLGGVVVGAQQAFTKLNPLIAVAAKAFELGSLASPTHGATLRGSYDLLQARVGQAFLPLMDAISLRIQQIADSYSQIQPTVNAVGRAAAAGIFGTPGGGFLDRRASTPGQRAGESLVRSFTAWVGETIEQRAPAALAERRQEQIQALSEARAGRRGRFLQGLAATADFIGATAIAGVGEEDARGARLKRAYAGLPPAQMMGYEQFGQMATLAGLQMDELTAERYQQQLQALEDIKELLTDIRDRREGGREIGRW